MPGPAGGAAAAGPLAQVRHTCRNKCAPELTNGAASQGQEPRGQWHTHGSGYRDSRTSNVVFHDQVRYGDPEGVNWVEICCCRSWVGSLPHCSAAHAPAMDEYRCKQAWHFLLTNRVWLGVQFDLLSCTEHVAPSSGQDTKLEALQGVQLVCIHSTPETNTIGTSILISRRHAEHAARPAWQPEGGHAMMNATNARELHTTNINKDEAFP